MKNLVRVLSSMACQCFFLGLGLGSGIVTIMYDRFDNEVKKNAKKSNSY